MIKTLHLLVSSAGDASGITQHLQLVICLENTAENEKENALVDPRYKLACKNQ